MVPFVPAYTRGGHMRTDWLAAVEDESPSGVEEIHPEQWGGEFPGKSRWLRYSERNRSDPSWYGVQARALNVLAVQRRPVPWLWSRA